MRLVMAGLDHTTADVEVRGLFAPDAGRQREIVTELAGCEVDGCALLVTCNRIELYLSHHGDVPPDGVDLLCRRLGRDAKTYRRHFVERHERQAVEHLMRVAAGLRSNVHGDDQIITQVRAAIESARDAGAADPVLEALFRAAVTAGKKIKTRVGFSREGVSVALRAVEAAEQRLGALAGRRALVVGNGVVGRLAADALLTRGAAVRMTLRDVGRRGELPAGCGVVDFDDRFEAMEGCDVVFSATASPRHTVTLAELKTIANIPPLFVDLAVPCDVEPAVGALPDTLLLNVDMLKRSGGNGDEAARRLAEADALVAGEVERFDRWRRARNRLRPGDGAPDFPIFINLNGVGALIAGGGRVAARRAEKLLGFGARVHVVSPEACPEMAALLKRGGLRWTRAAYHPRHIDGATLVIAATDDRAVNARVGRDARERGVLVSVADRRQECTFYFPAIVRSDLLTAGVISNNGDHRLVKRAASRLRDEMEGIDADCQDGEP